MSNLPTQADIDAVDAELSAAWLEVSRLERRRHELLTAQWDIKVGDIVRDLEKRLYGRVGRVVRVSTPYSLKSDQPRVEVRLQKKNGEFGSNSAHFWKWEKVV